MSLSPSLLSAEMQDDVKKAPVVPSAIDIMGVTLTMPILLLCLFLLAVALSKPVCDMYSSRFCVLPRFIPKFK